MSDWTDGEMLMITLAVAAIIFGLIALSCSRSPSPRAEPSHSLSMPVSPPPTLSPEEAVAVDHARATHQPVEFVQLNPQTGQPALFRATPMADGRTLISLTQPHPQPTIVSGFPGSTTKWVQ